MSLQPPNPLRDAVERYGFEMNRAMLRSIRAERYALDKGATEKVARDIAKWTLQKEEATAKDNFAKAQEAIRGTCSP